MPELPEVDTIRRQLAPVLNGRQVIEAWAHPSSKFSQGPQAVGATIELLTRRGKYLIAPLDDGSELIVHLGMTGSLRVAPLESIIDMPVDRYVRAWWNLDDGSRLIFRDVRRFGRIAVVEAGDYHLLPTLAHLGPEPFSDAFDGDHLWNAIRRSDRRIKTQLLSQRPVAGIGNIYADEALWLASINPADRSITRQRAAELVATIRIALQSGLDNGGTTLRNYVDAGGDPGTNQQVLHCYGLSGTPCSRCSTTLRSTSLDSRTTTWCPHCQPRRY